MPRLIDADALIEPMENAIMGVMSGCSPFNEPVKVLESAPTIDAVEVIRCRDCKWLYEADIRGKRRMVCDFMDCMMGDMDFCSKAERKE